MAYKSRRGGITPDTMRDVSNMTTEAVSGRTALITGASAGIGKAFAEVFAAKGWNVVLTARRAERLEALAAGLAAKHQIAATPIAQDLAVPEGVRHLVAKLAARGLTIDGLVNNAGFAVPGYYARTSWADQQRFLQVMVTAPCELTHALLPGMIERRFGRIVNVASVAGLIPGTPGHTLYAASKAFMVKFSESLLLENRRHNVLTTALCPGFTHSEFHDVAGVRQRVSKFGKAWWTTAEEVAEAGYDGVDARPLHRGHGPAQQTNRRDHETLAGTARTSHDCRQVPILPRRIASTPMSAAIVIPARYASSRFPGKPLFPSRERPCWSASGASRRACRQATRVVIATDDERILGAARSFDAEAIMTSPECGNGTERVHDAVQRAAIQEDIVLNLQGDALLTPPWVLEAMIDEMILDTSPDIVTPAVRLEGPALEEFLAQKQLTPASGTTVVFDRKRNALYFSKAVIPYMRKEGHAGIYRHIGLYGYRKAALARYVELAPSPLEQTEGLEQLRALENGMADPRRPCRLPGAHALVHRRAGGCRHRRADYRARRRVACRRPQAAEGA